MSFTRPVLLGPVFFRNALSCSRDYHLGGGVGWDAVTDAVGINCKKGTTSENKGADVKYMG